MEFRSAFLAFLMGALSACTESPISQGREIWRCSSLPLTVFLRGPPKLIPLFLTFPQVLRFYCPNTKKRAMAELFP